jgi:hypothetical protein
MVDDYCLAPGFSWDDLGVRLLRSLEEEVQERGVVMSLVVTAHKDVGKRGMLERQKFSLASEWWFRMIPEEGRG